MRWQRATALRGRRRGKFTRSRRRMPHTVHAPTPPSWGPPLTLGPRLRVQAQPGTRAAVMTLKPGLYLVSEVQTSEVELGLLPLLTPLLATSMVRQATRALRAKGRSAKDRPPMPVLPLQLPPRFTPWNTPASGDSS